jgi:hypothetical protein
VSADQYPKHGDTRCTVSQCHHLHRVARNARSTETPEEKMRLKSPASTLPDPKPGWKTHGNPTRTENEASWRALGRGSPGTPVFTVPRAYRSLVIGWTSGARESGALGETLCRWPLVNGFKCYRDMAITVKSEIADFGSTFCGWRCSPDQPVSCAAVAPGNFFNQTAGAQASGNLLCRGE